jgi:hypothetical protein
MEESRGASLETAAKELLAQLLPGTVAVLASRPTAGKLDVMLLCAKLLARERQYSLIAFEPTNCPRIERSAAQSGGRLHLLRPETNRVFWPVDRFCFGLHEKRMVVSLIGIDYLQLARRGEAFWAYNTPQIYLN